MKEIQLEQQSAMYLYDLMNEAKEHGFKSEDAWKLSIVNDEERTRIQKDYYPSVAVKLYPDQLLHVFHNTKIKLNQDLSKDEEELNTNTIIKNDLNHIIAYNLKRPRN